MQETADWERIIDGSLYSLSDFLTEGTWYGRENEVVNLFAHRFLLKTLGKGPLNDPSQIGIEVAVKQIPKVGGKKLVRKDLVLWDRPRETVWEGRAARNSPAVIMEWKTGRIAKCDADIKWLLRYTKLYPHILGYSVCAFIENNRGIRFRKIVNGQIRGKSIIRPPTQPN